MRLLNHVDSIAVKTGVLYARLGLRSRLQQLLGHFDFGRADGITCPSPSSSSDTRRARSTKGSIMYSRNFQVCFLPSGHRRPGFHTQIVQSGTDAWSSSRPGHAPSLVVTLNQRTDRLEIAACQIARNAFEYQVRVSFGTQRRDEPGQAFKVRPIPSGSLSVLSQPRHDVHSSDNRHCQHAYQKVAPQCHHSPTSITQYLGSVRPHV